MSEWLLWGSCTAAIKPITKVRYLQEQQLVRDADAYAAQSVRTASSRELFENVSYSPLNLGEAIGTLRIVRATDSRPPAPTDIVIYETLPNDLPLVAGVISAAPQTPLSHVNLRARQNGIANAYLRNALHDPQLNQFLNETVRLTVTADRIEIRSATAAEVSAAFASRRPAAVQFPLRDLGPRQILPLDEMLWSDTHAFGAKATNVAELRRTIDPKLVPNGFAVPFSFYDEFMRANNLYDWILGQMQAAAFRDDSQRPDILKAIRREIKASPVPDVLRDQLDAMHHAFPEGTTPRCRSSANNEDMLRADHYNALPCSTSSQCLFTSSFAALRRMSPI